MHGCTPKATRPFSQLPLVLFRLFSLSPELAILVQPALINPPRVRSMKVLIKVIEELLHHFVFVNEDVGLIILAQPASCQV